MKQSIQFFAAVICLVLGMAFISFTDFVDIQAASKEIQIKKYVRSNSNIKKLRKLRRKFAKKYRRQRKKLVRLYRKSGWSINKKTEAGSAVPMYLDRNGIPVFYETDNINAAYTISTDKVWPGGGLGLDLTGAGMTLSIWDKGGVFGDHYELSGRVIQKDVPAHGLQAHSTHVAGTMIATGLIESSQEPGEFLSRGMAYEAKLEAYDFFNNLAEMTQAAIGGMLISNHSTGWANGWQEGFCLNEICKEWGWTGDISISTTEDYHFGFYTSIARDWDDIVYNAPFFTIVKSASNNRNDRPQEQPVEHWVYDPVDQSYVFSNEIRDRDGGLDGYDSIPGDATAKNILTIGAVEDIRTGYNDPSEVIMTDFSGWGPTDDGRIKPDLVADGFMVYSPITPNSSTPAGVHPYSSYSGTSMSTPSVTGSLALVQQHYMETNGFPMKSATLKALAIHTADEAGIFPGPDFQFGWGLMNTKKAVELVSFDIQQSNIVEATLYPDETYTKSLLVGDMADITVTLCWTDPPGEVSEASLNPIDLKLVNDLDLRLKDNYGNTYYPWFLTPGLPAAGKGDNNRDNVEKIQTQDLSGGQYTIEISHKGDLENNSQDFSLIVNFFSWPLFEFNILLIPWPYIELPDIVFDIPINSYALISLESSQDLIYEVIRQPRYGTAQMTEEGELKYVPKRGYQGRDTFIMKIADREGFAITAEINGIVGRGGEVALSQKREDVN